MEEDMRCLTHRFIRTLLWKGTSIGYLIARINVAKSQCVLRRTRQKEGRELTIYLHFDKQTSKMD